MEGGDIYHRLLTVNKNTQHRLFGWYARGKRVALDVARGIHYLHSLHLTHFDSESLAEGLLRWVVEWQLGGARANPAYTQQPAPQAAQCSLLRKSRKQTGLAAAPTHPGACSQVFQLFDDA